MATREEIYRKFGPQLLEVLTLVIMDEINTIRGELALTPRTPNQLLTAMEAKWDTISKYDWMQRE